MARSIAPHYPPSTTLIRFKATAHQERALFSLWKFSRVWIEYHWMATRGNFNEGSGLMGCALNHSGTALNLSTNANPMVLETGETRPRHQYIEDSPFGQDYHGESTVQALHM
jgi:hypothetical protein